MNKLYTSPVAMPIVADETDDYRVLRATRKWLVSILVNGKRHYCGVSKHWVSEKTWCNVATLSPDVLYVAAFDSYPQARHHTALYWTEPTGNGFEMRASAQRVQRHLGTDIKPRVLIQIAMVETTADEPAWRTAAYRICTQPDKWYTQSWPEL